MSGESDTKARIFEAAEALFAERGFAATTVREIAARAGVNLAMIHYYFGNKEGLYRALIEAEIAHMRELMVGAAEAEGSYTERVEAFVRGYVRFLCARPNFARIVQQEMLSGGRVIREVFSPQIAKNYAVMRRIVEGGVEAGEFREIDAEIAPISLIGMVAFFMIARPVVSGIIGVDPADERFADRLAEHTARIFLDGVRRRDAAGGAEEPL